MPNLFSGLTEHPTSRQTHTTPSVFGHLKRFLSSRIISSPALLRRLPETHQH
ncbi:hypothetical protein JOB18_019804 [Solea senegalensis]|uniref:Uncharacterized protein n=1 Tax=Solea senegalensis TaxID=28829 RepID=A0AAV6R5Q0_SOLSE|nr:hypothetical protein JOB18_019804 [Solea senegalensis]